MSGNETKNIIRVNMTLLNDKAFIDIQKQMPNVEKCHGFAWLLGIKLKDENNHIALYPISSINPLAPPDFFTTHKECRDGVSNKKRSSLINKKLQKYSPDDNLIPHIKKLKKAINILSVDSLTFTKCSNRYGL